MQHSSESSSPASAPSRRSASTSSRPGEPSSRAESGAGRSRSSTRPTTASTSRARSRTSIRSAGWTTSRPAGWTASHSSPSPPRARPRRTPGSTSPRAPDRHGAVIATGIGGLQSYQDCYDQLRDRGPDRVNPFSIPQIIPNMGAAWVSMELGTKGPLGSTCTACAASNMAIGDGIDAIRLGRADVMLCGGSEAAVCEVAIAGFDAMRALSRRNDDPQRGEPAVRRPARRLRDGRGGRGARARGASSTRRRAARRSTRSCSATASRPTRTTSPSPTRPARAGARDPDGARGCRRRPGRRRLRQRARDVDADRRLLRDAGPQARVRRGVAKRTAGLRHEGRDRALPRRLGRGGGAVHDARRRDGLLPPTINQERRIPSAISTTCRTWRARPR